MGELCNGNCGNKTGFIHGKKFIDKKPYCNECYYLLLGELIEKHPIGMIPPQQNNYKRGF